MNANTIPTHNSSSPEEKAIRTLYQHLLDCWNRHSAEEFATLFAENGNVVGFDGSPLNGRSEIASELQRIFDDHRAATYIGKVREVRFLAPEVALLRAVAGMVPPGQADLNPAVNTIQTLVAIKRADLWQVALFQNTPAQFHGRPELVRQLTNELRQLL